MTIYAIVLSQKFKNRKDITVVSAMPHTHSSGTQVWTKIVRKGVEIGYLFRNKFYDSNLQQSFEIDPTTLTKVQKHIISFTKYLTTLIDKMLSTLT